MSTKITMSIEQALELVKLSIKNEKSRNACELIDSLIEQMLRIEKNYIAYENALRVVSHYDGLPPHIRIVIDEALKQH